MPWCDQVHLVAACRDTLGDRLHEASDRIAAIPRIRRRHHDDALAHWGMIRRYQNLKPASELSARRWTPGVTASAGIDRWYSPMRSGFQSRSELSKWMPVQRDLHLLSQVARRRDRIHPENEPVRSRIGQENSERGGRLRGRSTGHVSRDVKAGPAVDEEPSIALPGHDRDGSAVGQRFSSHGVRHQERPGGCDRQQGKQDNEAVFGERRFAAPPRQFAARKTLSTTPERGDQIKRIREQSKPPFRTAPNGPGHAERYEGSQEHEQQKTALWLPKPGNEASNREAREDRAETWQPLIEPDPFVGEWIDENPEHRVVGGGDGSRVEFVGGVVQRADRRRHRARLRA